MMQKKKNNSSVTSLQHINIEENISMFQLTQCGISCVCGCVRESFLLLTVHISSYRLIFVAQQMITNDRVVIQIADLSANVHHCRMNYKCININSIISCRYADEIPHQWTSSWRRITENWCDTNCTEVTRREDIKDCRRNKGDG